LPNLQGHHLALGHPDAPRPAMKCNMLLNMFFEGGKVMLDKSHKKWKDLVTGKMPLQTDNLGLQMFLKRTTTKLATQAAPVEVEKAVTELHSFFLKYERILQKELAIISK
jgi:hypothetical protein